MIQSMIPFYGVPVLNRGDMLLRLAKSFDYPIGHFHIVNNGTDESVLDAIAQIQAGVNDNIKKVVVDTFPGNLGVAGSWNHMIQSNPQHPYHIISAFDTVLRHPGDLQRIAEQIEREHETTEMFYVDGYSYFCMTKLGLKNIGTFDENIYPAYLEDSDHWRRSVLSGAKLTGISPKVEFIHGDGVLDGSVTINSNPKYAAANGITHGMNHEYYISKWGGSGGHEKFATPFNNNPEHPLNYWVLNQEARLARKKVWGTA